MASSEGLAAAAAAAAARASPAAAVAAAAQGGPPQDVFRDDTGDTRSMRCRASARFLHGSSAAAAAAAASGGASSSSTSAAAATAAAATLAVSHRQIAGYIDKFLGGLGGWMYASCCGGIACSSLQQQQRLRRLQPRSNCRGRGIAVDVSLAGGEKGLLTECVTGLGWKATDSFFSSGTYQATAAPAAATADVAVAARLSVDMKHLLLISVPSLFLDLSLCLFVCLFHVALLL